MQGVGFRPFIFRLAQHYSLVGNIRNTGEGVEISVQGEETLLVQFQEDLIAKRPAGSRIDALRVDPLPIEPFHEFSILPSIQKGSSSLSLLADTAICSQCLQDLKDPSCRRYRYPFVHCVSCGPRFSLLHQIPFDRGHTSMCEFPMCKECLQEYEDPNNRRFYSQTNCCPSCGPKLSFRRSSGESCSQGEDALQMAIEALKQGDIVAVKSTGGYQLLADATSKQVVEKLRRRKRRPTKPFALLISGIEEAHRMAHVSTVMEETLYSSKAPIVLCPQRKGSFVVLEVTCSSPYYGLMLPHNGLQHLLVEALQRPLVATSGNVSGKPLCITEEEAFTDLMSIADAFLVHNRKIVHRLDDSVVHVIGEQPVMIRRARGYIPYVLEMEGSKEGGVLGTGSHMKNTFALAKGPSIYMSQHIGDLESVAACQSYEKEIEKWENLLSLKVETAICDMHPQYHPRQYLERKKISFEEVQHHHAHIFSGKIDTKIPYPFLAITWDGTGWGEDGTIWGGEGFAVTEKEMTRVSTIHPFRLPGAEAAVKEPRRAALGMLFAAYGESIPPKYRQWLREQFTEQEIDWLLHALQKGVQSPITTSIGRLFDGISALSGTCLHSHFEGEAAVCLEARALHAPSTGTCTFPLFYQDGLWILDWRPILDVVEMARPFHQALAGSVAALAKHTGLKNVLLTGGVMQNKFLAEQIIDVLRLQGCVPYWHENIPPNDGGLSVGQIAAMRG